MKCDIESWEAHSDLHDRRDYPAIVLLCEAEVASDPEDLDAQERLGQAYVLNGDFASAISAMTNMHRAHPEIDAFSHIILDALFATGKTERDYQWIVPPLVLRLGKEVHDICYDYLQPKRRPRDLSDLHCQLMIRGYLTFCESELLQSLAADPRFYVVGDHPLDAKISVVRKRRRRTG